MLSAIFRCFPHAKWDACAAYSLSYKWMAVCGHTRTCPIGRHLRRNSSDGTTCWRHHVPRKWSLVESTSACKHQCFLALAFRRACAFNVSLKRVYETWERACACLYLWVWTKPSISVSSYPWTFSYTLMLRAKPQLYFFVPTRLLMKFRNTFF